MLTVALLGPVELRRDGVPVRLPAGRATELLARLALEPGTVIRTERLVDDLWAGRPAAPNTFQSKVSMLRRALGDATLLPGTPTGYCLLVGSDAVDVTVALRLAGTAAGRLNDGDPTGALAAADRGLGLYRGDVLDGAGDAEWLHPHRARLGELRLSLVEIRLSALIELGGGGAVIGEIEAAVADDPLREEVWALLITALYRAGRQADSLAAYDRVRRALAEQLGLEPGPRLRDLHSRILRQEVRTVARPVETGIGNLPMPIPLIGRDEERARIDGLLREKRLVTLSGPAGVGKTRLAIETSRRAGHHGGAWLVRLETVRDADGLWPTVGAAFGLGETTEPLVLDRLRGFDLLLVLDNCEHLVDVMPALIERLLGAAEGVRILATSQVPIGIAGEEVFTVDPLTPGDAVRLFTDRAHRTHRSFDADPEALHAICRRLDGLPLAIELAAARSKVLTAAQIAQRLDDRFALLADPRGRGERRHRTLHAAIGWSYDLLFPDDQRGLWALACFADGAELPAVEAVLTALGIPAGASIDVLDRLVDRSLVRYESGERDQNGGRYRLLDSIRAFGRDRLRESGLTDVAHHRHAEWFAQLADAAGSGTRGAEQPRHLRTARSFRPDIEAALAWTAEHDPPLGIRIVAGFGWTWAVLGAGPDAARRIRSALAADPNDPRRPGCLLIASWLEAAGGDLALAAADLDEAMAGTEPEGRLVAEVYLAFLRTQQGRPQDVLTILDQAGPGLEAAGLDWEVGAGHLLEAWAAIALGDVDRGRRACDESLRRLRPFGDEWALIHAEALLGNLAQAEHRFDDAVGHLRRAADAAHRLGFAGAEALHLSNLGRALQQGGLSTAADVQREAIEKAQAAGDLRLAALARVRLARVLRESGDDAGASAQVTRAQDWFAAAGGGDGTAMAGLLRAVLDRDDAALFSVLERSARNQDVETQLLALDAVARRHAEDGRQAPAHEALAEADTLLPRVAHLVAPTDRLDAALAHAHLTRLPGSATGRDR